MTSGENEMEVKAENEHQYFSKTKESQEMFPFVFFDIVVGIACLNSEGIPLCPAPFARALLITHVLNRTSDKTPRASISSSRRQSVGAFDNEPT
ncbi:MAG: hypothetical protein PHS50_07800 [Kiritimatiellae bacterium]|nr:hypothetical protein [Kiritimatiellia bacterium]